MFVIYVVIHSCIHFKIPAVSYSGSWGGWSLFQLLSSEGQRHLSVTGPTQKHLRQTTTPTHTHSEGQFRTTCEPNVHVFGLWDEDLE